MASVLERISEWFTRTDTDLHGQVAFITGGGRGLGLLLARSFAAEGCRIAICARDAAELEAAQHDLKGRGAEVATFTCDVSDRTQVNATVDDVTRRLGRVDILVNNAGVIQVGPMPSMRLEDYQEAMDVMFWGGTVSHIGGAAANARAWRRADCQHHLYRRQDQRAAYVAV